MRRRVQENPPLTHRLLQNNCLFRCVPRHCSSFHLGLYRPSSIPLEIALHVALLCSRTFSRCRSRTMPSPCLSWTRSRLVASFFLVSSSTIYGGYSEPKWYVISAGLSNNCLLTFIQMVKVATSLDVPIKILWPKSMVFSTERGFTMLGLGDIVIPGMFVAMALRYDYHQAAQRKSTGSVSKVYFQATLGAYASGLFTTMTVMHVFKKAQPALLYLRCALHYPFRPIILADPYTVPHVSFPSS